MSEKMIGDSLVEHSFKDKGTVKTHAPLPLALILLVQNSAEVGVVGVEMTTAVVGTCKGSLNRSWGCSGKTLRRSNQYSASIEIECSSGNFSRVLR